MSTGIPGMPEVPEMEVAAAREYIAQHAGDADFVLLDVRSPEEIEEAHISGCRALDLNGGVFARELPRLDPQRDYLMVCRSGNRSGYAAALMLNLGFRRVVNMEGGMLAWLRAGYPVEDGAVDSA